MGPPPGCKTRVRTKRVRGQESATPNTRGGVARQGASWGRWRVTPRNPAGKRRIARGTPGALPSRMSATHTTFEERVRRLLLEGAPNAAATAVLDTLGPGLMRYLSSMLPGDDAGDAF